LSGPGGRALVTEPVSKSVRQFGPRSDQVTAATLRSRQRHSTQHPPSFGTPRAKGLGSKAVRGPVGPRLPTLTCQHRVACSMCSLEGPMTCSAMYSPADGGSQPQSPEVRLLKRVRDRTDAGAWNVFVDEYQPVLRAFVRRQGVYASDVPDVVQEIFAQLV